MVSFKEYINQLILNKCKKEILFKTVVIQAVLINQLESFIEINPEFIKIVTELEQENIIYKNGYYKINSKNYNLSKYRTMLEDVYKSKDFESFVMEFNLLWKDKKGITDNGYVYSLLDAAQNRIELARFLDKNDVDYTTIISATREFFNVLNKNPSGYYLFSPRSNVFITGNAKNAYLIEYCNNIKQNIKAQNTIKEFNNESFYTDYTGS